MEKIIYPVLFKWYVADDDKGSNIKEIENEDSNTLDLGKHPEVIDKYVARGITSGSNPEAMTNWVKIDKDIHFKVKYGNDKQR